MADWILLDLASQQKGGIVAAFTCSLSADAPCLFWQEQRVQSNQQRLRLDACYCLVALH